MRQLYCLLLLVLIFFSCTSTVKLNGIYVSDIKDTLIIGQSGSIINSKGHRDQEMIVKQRNDLLKFKTTWYPNRIFNPPHKLYFRILSTKGNEKVILLPVTRWAKLMFEQRDSIVLNKVQ